MPLLTPSERSALEVMLRRQLGSGAGTTVMLKVFDYVNESYVEPVSGVTPEVEVVALVHEHVSPEPTTPVATGEVAVEVTESSP